MLCSRVAVAPLSLALALAACAEPEPSRYLDLVEAFGRAAVSSSEHGPPRIDGRDRLLFLPAGTRLDYAFELAERSSLRFERLATRGRGTRIRVRLESDSAVAPFEALVERPSAQPAIQLPELGGEAVRLTVEVVADTPEAGDGALLTGAAVWGAPEPAPRVEPVDFERVERPNVLIYLIDTLRRDRLSGYGYERPVSPHLDELAETATLFESGIGQSSWTKASVASMWTGVWPPTHGATGWGHGLPEDFETLAERLRAAGYQTAAFVTNVNASPAFGLDQGFDHVWYEKKRRSDRVNDEVLAWLDASRVADRPLFLYVHTMDPHAGYNPGEPFRSEFAPTADQMKPWKPRWRWPIENLPFFSDLYDGEIAQNDAAFGELVAALRQRQLFDDSLVIALSDHGEEFKEHGGWRHGRVLHYGSLDVPMIVKLPGQTTSVRSTVPASHVDVLPTVLEVTGLPAAEGDGQSLIAPTPRPIFSHLRLGRAPLQYSVVDRGWKLIQVHGDRPRTRLYDLRADPEETEDLSESLPVRVALLEGLLRDRLAATRATEAEEVEMTEELERSLRALGYLQ